jgi:hypothetical protein
MSFFKEVVMLLIAAGAANADPIGPNACPSNINPYEWDEVKGWWGVSWTNGDATAYTYFSEDGGSTVSDTVFPGVTSYTPYWTLAQVTSGNLRMKHVKNGVDDSCGWQTIDIAA